MTRSLRTAALFASALFACGGSSSAPPASHVLLISIDGLHQQDLARFISGNAGSALAALSQSGVVYTAASSSKPSDSFPGMLALATGGNPQTTGVWYDDSFARDLYPPKSVVNISTPADTSDCTNIGTEVLFDETIDLDNTQLNGGGGINPDVLPRQIDASGKCVPVYPHSFLRVNTIFEVIKAAGKRTAWSDKHPAYELLNGPSGKGLDDLYAPEIASVDPVSQKHWDKLPSATLTYDDKKVQAVLNWIDGKSSDGSTSPGVPAVFGMNFQALSVAQKDKGGGYTDASATPSAAVATALTHTDASIGLMVAELKKQNLFNSTLIIITAKHGQSPIDVSKRTAVDDSQYGMLIGGLLGVGRVQTDDVALIWAASNSPDTSTKIATQLNNGNGTITPATLGFDHGHVYAGSELAAQWDDPSGDPRTPSVIVQPNPGVIYTSGSKIAEHGGLSDDDVHVGLLVSLPTIHASSVSSAVTTTQVAPTILKALGLDPTKLQAVHREGTASLPSLPF